MFSNLFSQSDKIEVITDFDQTPIVGKYIGADSAFLYISDIEDSVQAIALPHVLRCRTVSAVQVSQLASELLRIETGSQVQAAAESAAASAEGTAAAIGKADSTQPETLPGHSAEETNPADGPAVTSIRDVIKEEGLALTPTLPFPKVLGKIDLESVDTKKRQRIPADENREFRKDIHSYSKTDDYGKRREWRKDNDLWHLYPEAMGEVKSVRFKFGFITTKDGEDLCFQGYNKADKLMPGDKVLFTTYEYPGKGTQARSVVRVRSVGAMLKKLDRMDEFEEKMKIDDIKEQLRAAFPDNEEVLKALDGESVMAEDDFEPRPQKEPRPRKVSANEFKLDLKRMASRMLPDNYVSYRIMIGEMIEAKKNSEDPYERNLVYDLYTTLIKNSFGREERSRFIDEAVDYYRSIGQDVKADYFERLKSSGQDRFKESSAETMVTSEFAGHEATANEDVEVESTDELGVEGSAATSETLAETSETETVTAPVELSETVTETPVESSESETDSSAESSEADTVAPAEHSEVEAVNPADTSLLDIKQENPVVSK